MPRTKIVATIGPASDSPEVLRALIDAGLSVARLNASHTSREDLTRRLGMIRAAAEAASRQVAVMLDLGGPKIRVGEMSRGTVLEAGSRFELRAAPCIGDAAGACVTYQDLVTDVPAGARVLVDDGRIELHVVSARAGRLITDVVTGGPLTSHKGVNVPSVRLGVDTLTEEDHLDVSWAVESGVDLIAQSFVRSAREVEGLRALLGSSAIPIVAKIEKHEAVGELESIVRAADAVMVARGDLGVETSPEQVPVIQRRVVEACRRAGKPVIVATEMLESMTVATRPTRAEASDVANAIFDQVDAVMLSAETAVGQHPVAAVATMGRIATVAEQALNEQREDDVPSGPVPGGRHDVTRAVSVAASRIERELELAAIVTATQSGATARAVAAHRPRTPIVAVTPQPSVARGLALVWGVTPLVVPQHGSIDEMLSHAVSAVRDAGLAEPGSLVALTAGVAVGVAGATNLLQVARV